MGYDHIFNYNKTMLPASDVWTYGKLYREHRRKLLFRLLANKFNWCKSDLKIAEAAWTKTAVIASNTKTIQRKVIRHGETGMLCRTSRRSGLMLLSQWTRSVAKTDARNNLFDDLRDHEDYNLDKVNLKRLKVSSYDQVREGAVQA
jgi:hypothetical protein